MSARSWHVAQWTLRGARRIAKLTRSGVAGAAIATGLRVAGTSAWDGVSIAQSRVLGILSLGLPTALLVSPPARSWLVPFAMLMLAGDVPKLAFLRAHQVTVRGASPRTMIGLASVSAAGHPEIVQSRNGVDTSCFLGVMFTDGSPEDLGGSSSFGSISWVGSVEVVELKERNEG